MEKVEKGGCMISMHSPHLPDGKITFTVENGYVSGKQLLTALGLKARVLLPKIQDAPQITLKSTSKPDSLGFLPESLVLVMKSVRLASVKNPLAITFVIDTLSDVVNSRGSIYEQMEDAKIVVPEPKVSPTSAEVEARHEPKRLCQTSRPAGILEPKAASTGAGRPDCAARYSHRRRCPHHANTHSISGPAAACSPPCSPAAA